MKLLKLLAISGILSLGSQLQAAKYSDYDFKQERMLLASDGIYAISSFDSQDVVSAYTHHGAFLWHRNFNSKILSWEIAGNSVFVFSKSRSGQSTYLTCLDRYDGRVIWERP